MDAAVPEIAAALVAAMILGGVLLRRHRRREALHAARRPADRATAYVNPRRAYGGVFFEPRAAAMAGGDEWSAARAEAPGAGERMARHVAEPVATAGGTDRSAGVSGGSADPLRDPDPFVRIAAIERLGATPGSEPALLAALRDEFPQVRREAIRALAATGHTSVIHALSDIAGADPSAEVREEAIAALGSLARRRAAGDAPS